jgi:hypothetical protein
MAQGPGVEPGMVRARGLLLRQSGRPHIWNIANAVRLQRLHLGLQFASTRLSSLARVQLNRPPSPIDEIPDDTMQPTR